MSVDIQEKIRKMFNATYVDHEYVMSNIFRVCREMLTDRGCEFVNVTEDVEGAFIQNDEFTCPMIIGSMEPMIHIFFSTEDRISVKILRSIMESNEADNVIFISFDGATTFAKREAMQSWGNIVQFFKYKELVFNVTHHKLVPKHIKCTDAERCDPKKKEKYPKIPYNDPVCQYYNFEIGDVIQIIRTSGSTHPHSHYRLVVY
tara:strand:+ start:86 stop:694 length:609 start_codon:yes stop_codon:yes gene_type:complete